MHCLMQNMWVKPNPFNHHFLLKHHRFGCIFPRQEFIIYIWEEFMSKVQLIAYIQVDGSGQIMMTERESYSVAEIGCDREQAVFGELYPN